MRCPVALLALAVLALAGCGRDGARDAARATVERFGAALEQRDGAAACAELTDAASSELERSQRVPCAEAILEQGLGGGAPASSEVYGSAARVRTDEGDDLFLGDTDRGWRISAAGCRPAADKGPEDCEVQG